MYLHIGSSVVIPVTSIVAVMDMDNSTQSYRTREFLSGAERRGEVVDVSGELPRSFVVCEEDGRRTVYLSQLSSATLLKRSENLMLFENL